MQLSIGCKYLMTIIEILSATVISHFTACIHQNY